MTHFSIFMTFYLKRVVAVVVVFKKRTGEFYDIHFN